MKRIYTLFLCISTLSSIPAHADFAFNLRRAQRRIFAHTIKSAVSNFDELKAVPTQNQNGDELLYTDKRGSFNKALKHQDSGFPDVNAFASLVRALDVNTQALFNNIILGGTRHLVNPQGAFFYSLSANDGWINAIPAAPAFASAETAGEMVEDYWTVLLRDTCFFEFGTNGTAAMAVTDLNKLSDFKGPKIGGAVTTGTLLRGNAPGELVGPFISQFLYLDVPTGPMTLKQLVMSPMAGEDYMTSFTDWFAIVNGESTGGALNYNGERYIITPRDLTEFVHKDFPCFEGTNAALILTSFGSGALDPANPYTNNATQDGFVSFGLSELLDLVQAAAHEALKTAWYQKWLVNRRLRPEEFGFYLDYQLTNGTNLGIHSDLLNSAVLPLIAANQSNRYFLAQAYPEGSPAHPSYIAGHACFIGAGITILKAWFNENFVIPNPMVPDCAHPDVLTAYTGDDLTVGGELNKLASNVSLGRDMAGVHYRSDGWQGMLLGEQVAIDLLNNTSFLFNENFAGFSLTTFEGKKITVGGRRTV